MTIPVIPVIIRTHLNASGSSNNDIEKFMPKIPATTPKIATTNVAVVSNSSNWISWFRTLSCKHPFPTNSDSKNPYLVFIKFKETTLTFPLLSGLLRFMNIFCTQHKIARFQANSCFVLCISIYKASD